VACTSKGITGRQSAFTIIELVIIIAVLALLATAAVPAFFDLSGDASRSAEDAVVGNVRAGIQLYSMNSAANTGVPCYPAELDSEKKDCEASDETPLFVNVVEGGVTAGWTKRKSDRYEGPTGTIYSYLEPDGTFLAE